MNLGFLQMLGLVGLAGLVLGAACAGAWFTLNREKLSEIEPDARLRQLLTLLALPLLLGVGLVALVLTPSVLDALGLVTDHCHVHPGHPAHHFHLCALHGASIEESFIGWVILLAVGGGLLVRVLSTVYDYLKAARELSCLKCSKETDQGACFSKVPTERPFAFVSGIFDPEIFVSRGLWKELGSEQRDILLSHETAHITNNHGLTILLAQILAVCHVPFVGQSLRSHVQLACEQIADRTAANRAGSRLDVAELLVKIGRLIKSDRPQTAQLRFGSDQLSRRVVGLVEKPWDKEKRSWLEPALLGAAVVALLNYSGVHHFVESTLGMLH